MTPGPALPDVPDPTVTWALEGLAIFAGFAVIACATGLVALRMTGLEGAATLTGLVAAFVLGARHGSRKP